MTSPRDRPYSLGRRVEHDPRSRLYAFRRAMPIETVQHISLIDVLDQGNLGSCTGNAAVGCIGYPPFFETLVDVPPLTQTLARAIYSEATHIDEFEGEWPPTDTGSSGLGVAKALRARGYISGYQWMFSFLDVLGALMLRPLIVGTPWYEQMFYPSPSGLVTPGGPVAGGHEYILDGWDDAEGVCTLRNSWGPSWGVGGRFHMLGADMARLLREDGDATLFVPRDLPTPGPTPPAPEPKGCLTGWWS